MKFNVFETVNIPDKTKCSRPVCRALEDGSIVVSYTKKGEQISMLRDPKGKWSSDGIPAVEFEDATSLRLDDMSSVTAETVGRDEKRVIIRRCKAGSKFIKCAELRLPDAYRKEGVTPALSSPQLWSNAGRSVHMVMASSAGFLFRADSYDGGRSWNTPFPLNVTNPGSSISLAVHSNRDFYLLCNPSGSKRTPIALYQSGTDGCTYKRLSVLVSGAGEFTDPYLCFESGKLYITFIKNSTEVTLAVVEL